MILDKLNDDFLIIAHRGDSAHHPGNTLAAFEAAAKAGAHLIEANLRQSVDGHYFCSNSGTVGGRKLEHMFGVELEEAGLLSVEKALAFSKDSGVPLVLDLRSSEPGFGAGVVDVLKRHHMEDRTVIGVNTLSQTSETRRASKDVGIVGFLDRPKDFPSFYKRGGNVARLWQGDTTPQNVRLAEAAEGRNRRPFWVMAGYYPNDKIARYGDIDLQGVFSMKSGPVAAKGLIVNDPALAVEAVRRTRAPSPSCGSLPVD